MNLVGIRRSSRWGGALAATLIAASMAATVVAPPASAAATMVSAERKIGGSDIEGAIRDYESVAAAEPSNVKALTYAAVWRQAIGDTAGSQAAINRLPTAQAQKAVSLMQNVQKALTFPLTDQVPAQVPAGTGIVILGYGLQADGAMRPLLVERLGKGLAVARAYPNFPIIVTGGNPKAGRTEAGQMRDWLIAQGVAANRITVEDKAVSTQSNALNSVRLYPQAGITNGIVLVTSSDHTRRSVADFLIAGSTEQAVVASDAKAQSAPLSRGGLILVYRDALGTAGL